MKKLNESKTGKERAEESKVLDYDYYGAYPDIPRRKNYGYEKRLEEDYTFGWPKCHDNIGREHKYVLLSVYPFTYTQNKCNFNRACREKGAVFDQSAFGKFILKGKDAGKALEWLCTNSVQDKVR